MLRNTRIWDILILAVLILCGCQPLATPTIQQPEPTAMVQVEPIIDPESKQPIRILFLGNSDSFWNEGIDAHVRTLAASANPPILLDTEISGFDGAALWDLLELGDTVDKIRSGEWDVVIMQNAGWWEAEKLPDAVAGLTEEIEAADALPILFAHWNGAQDPRSELSLKMAADLDIPVLRTGLAWDKSMSERPDLLLRDSSTDYHASVPGTYLNTAVIFAMLFGQSPVGLAYRPVDLLPDPASAKPGFRRDIERLHEQWQIPEEDIAFLQRVAWETVVENQ